MWHILRVPLMKICSNWLPKHAVTWSTVWRNGGSCSRSLKSQSVGMCVFLSYHLPGTTHIHKACYQRITNKSKLEMAARRYKEVSKLYEHSFPGYIIHWVLLCPSWKPNFSFSPVQLNSRSQWTHHYFSHKVCMSLT